MRGLTLGGCISALVLILGPNFARADYISNVLGAAGPSDFAILALSGASTVNLNGPGFSNGNVGVVSGTLGLAGSAGPEVHGNVYLASGASVQGNNQVTGTVYQNYSLSVANADALAAAKTFAGLTPTLSVAGGQITGPGTINGTSGINVLNVSNINISNGVLTLNAPAGAEFIINDSGGLTLNAGQIDLSGGLTNNDVVFNMTNGGKISTSHGLNDESVINGIVLGPTSDVGMSPGMINGELIAGGSNIQIVSGGSVITNVAIIPSVPEPPAVLMTLVGGVLFPLVMSRLSRKRLAPQPQ